MGTHLQGRGYTVAARAAHIAVSVQCFLTDNVGRTKRFLEESRETSSLKEVSFAGLGAAPQFRSTDLPTRKRNRRIKM